MYSAGINTQLTNTRQSGRAVRDGVLCTTYIRVLLTVNASLYLYANHGRLVAELTFVSTFQNCILWSYRDTVLDPVGWSVRDAVLDPVAPSVLPMLPRLMPAARDIQ